MSLISVELLFTEALWAEYQGTGIRVLAVCPGSTHTAFFDVVAAPEALVEKLTAYKIDSWISK